MGRRAAIAGLVFVCGLLSACARWTQQAARSYTTVVADGQHDADAARAHCERAAQAFDNGHLEKAEAALQDALIADVSYAPAHNNLGHVYFEQGRLYLAAWEFEYARRLLPNSAEVTNNLGLVYEAGQQLPRAIEHYRLAVALDPGNPVLAGNLARALVREGEDSPEVTALLQTLALHDTRADWVAWARDQLNLQTTAQAGALLVAPRQPPGAEPLPPPVPEETKPLSVHVDDASLPPAPAGPPRPVSEELPR